MRRLGLGFACVGLIVCGAVLGGLARAQIYAAPPVPNTSDFVRQSDLPAAIQQNSPVTSVNGKVGAITTATLPGLYNVQPGGAVPLPDPSTVGGRYANASDVGGSGANGGNGYAQLYSTGLCWRRTSPYTSPLPIAAAATINIKSLVQSSVIQITGTAFNSAATINVTSACPGDVFTVMVPSGVLGLLGGISVSINGSSVLPTLLGNGTWADYVWTGTGIMKVRGGSL